jgi:acyl-CoA thioesterase
MTEKLVIARKRFAKDRFAAALGITLDQLTDNSVTMHMQLSEDMVNWFDRPHGGAVYCLADAAFSVLANNGETLAVALECSITYHASPPSDALLVVEGRPCRPPGKLRPICSRSTWTMQKAVHRLPP